MTTALAAMFLLGFLGGIIISLALVLWVDPQDDDDDALCSCGVRGGARYHRHQEQK